MNDVARHNLMTLENYVERYQPIMVARIINKVLYPLMTSDA